MKIRAFRPLYLAILLALALGAPIPAAAQTAPAPDAPAAVAGDTTSSAVAPPGLIEARKKKDDEEKKDDAKKGGEAKPGGGQGKGDAKPFEEVVKDFQVHEGLFNIYTKDDKSFLELRPDQLDTYYMLTLTRVGGIGQFFNMLGNQMSWNTPVMFKKTGDHVQLLLKNVYFRADSDKHMAQAVERSFSDSLFSDAPAASQPHPERKSFLVDLRALFIGDPEGVMAFTAAALQSPYKMDDKNSYLGTLKTFPKNVEIEATLHYANPVPKVGIPTLVDNRSMFLRYNFSLSALPDGEGFHPRLADDRVGHFLSAVGEFSDDREAEPSLRYVTKWKLEKADPLLEVSPVKEPITYYIDRSVPEKYHAALTEGITVWNSAFERIGFKDAVAVKEAPADPQWDSSDVRYASVRWFVTTEGNFAIGPSQANPFTGQIYDADIGFSEGMMRGARNRFREEVSPLAMFRAAADEANHTAMHGWAEQLEKLSSPTAMGNPASMCNIGEELVQHAAFGYEVMRARGMKPGSAEEDKYVRDYLVAVTAHEVGHTLGLRHNYRASTMLDNKDLQNAEKTTKMGLTGSVMDYTTVNLAANGEPQGQYWQTTLGPYDYWAIEYAYKPIEAESPKAELPELAKIASRAPEQGLAYSTDEDAMGFSAAPLGMDPRSHQWDLGRDPIEYYTGRMKIARELWASLPGEVETQGEGYQIVRKAFNRGLIEYFPAATSVTKYVGGVMHNRYHVGDPGGAPPYVPVPAAEQRRALKFLVDNYFAADAFRFDSKLVTALAADRFGIYSGFVFLPRLDYPIHDTVLAMQNLVLARLYHPALQTRVVDMGTKTPDGQDFVDLAEIFGTLRDGIWSEVKGSGTNIDSFRRALQRQQLDYLVQIATGKIALAPAEAVTLARYDLTELKKRIGTALGSASLNEATKAHLTESMGVIEHALDAAFIRGV